MRMIYEIIRFINRKVYKETIRIPGYILKRISYINKINIVISVYAIKCNTWTLRKIQ